MTYFPERVLTEELARARTLLEQALAILDEHHETEAGIATCNAIEILIGAPTVMEQWFVMTGRRPDGSSKDQRP
jgi:hypothetical protein